MREREVQRRRKEVRGDDREAVKMQIGKDGRHATGHEVWAQFVTTPATCLNKWPQEKCFQILANRNLGEVPKLHRV